MKRLHFSIIVYFAIGILAITAYIYINELNTPTKVHVYLTDFALDGNQSHMIFRFESGGGAFTTGEKIHANILLATDYPSIIGKHVMIHFPQTLDPQQYDEIKNKKNWEVTQDGSSVKFSFPDRHFGQWYGTSITVELDLVYTQEGPQDAIFMINDGLPEFDETGKLNYGNHVVLEDVITIQPSDVRLQIKTNNWIIGLTVLIITLTIVTFYSNYDRIGIKLDD